MFSSNEANGLCEAWNESCDARNRSWSTWGVGHHWLVPPDRGQANSWLTKSPWIPNPQRARGWAESDHQWPQSFEKSSEVQQAKPSQCLTMAFVATHLTPSFSFLIKKNEHTHPEARCLEARMFTCKGVLA